ncbi:MAG: DUF5716 family protein [Defluviitaleaceae bacterium]|nr:DUF5716 family protein [Defluviitaleaceae bacterium]
MYWKKFKSQVSSGTPPSEAHFVLGIDIGNDSSSISFFNANTGQAEVIDISGGYGKPSIPTAMQYIPETKEWVYGEYAVLGEGSANNVQVTGLLDRLGKREYFDVDGRSISVVTLLGMYLKELVAHIYSINPKAEIVGVVAAIPSYLSDEAKAEFLQAFQKAGLEKELIGFVTDRECVLHGYFQGGELGAQNMRPARKPQARKPRASATNGKLLLLDLGARELRGTVFDILALSESSIQLRSTSSLFEGNISANVVNSLIGELFTLFYCDNFGLAAEKISPSARAQLDSFSYQHRDILFQKNIKSKPARLYFNFAYPAFSRTVDEDEVASLIHDIELRMKDFISKLLKNNAHDGSSLQASDIDVVLAYGGGFEMIWARELVKDFFRQSDVLFRKNSKSRVSEGAAVAAARKLSLLPDIDFQLQDLNRVNVDIGIMITQGRRTRFHPLVEQSSFWWQKRPPVHFILGDAVASDHLGLQLFRRNSEGDIDLVDEITLIGLPERPRGATRLSVDISFKNFNFVTCRVKDLGFGEMFPRSEMSAEKSFFI